MLSLMLGTNTLCICQHGCFGHILIPEHFRCKPYLIFTVPEHRPLTPEAVTAGAGEVNKLISLWRHFPPSLTPRMTTAAKNGHSILLDRQTRHLFSDTGKCFFPLYLVVLLLTGTKHTGRTEQNLYELIIAQKPKYSWQV